MADTAPTPSIWDQISNTIQHGLVQGTEQAVNHALNPTPAPTSAPAASSGGINMPLWIGVAIVAGIAFLALRRK